MNFIKLLFAATAEAVGGTPVFVPTSPKLDELKLAKKAAWSEMLKYPDPDTKEAKDASLAYFKASNDVKAEEAELIKAENDRITQEKRNERLMLNARQLTAYLAFKTADPKKTPADKLAELETAFNTAKEAVDNELLAKYAGSSSAKKSASNDGTDKTAGTADTDAKCWPLFAAGKSNKEVEIETGIPRSTVWFSSDRYKKANGIK